MIRLFNVYYSKRTIILLVFELLLVSGSFLVAARYLLGPDTEIALFYQYGWLKIFAMTCLTLLLTYYFDLYEPRRMAAKWEIYFRLLLVLSVLSFILAAVIFALPDFDIGRNVGLVGVALLTVVLLLWRWAYGWVISLRLLRERVYVLGSGGRASSVVNAIRSNRDSGMEVVGWTEEGNADAQLRRFIGNCASLRRPKASVDRIIVAMEDRRNSLPIRELLNLRLCGVIIEGSSEIMEQLTGSLPLEGLYPSVLIFADGFRVRPSQEIVRRCLSFVMSLAVLLVCLPFIPFIMLVVHLSSPGPVFFKQSRVGQFGRLFTALKFRTMRQDAESNGAVWATENDQRVTPIGRFMRKTHLDEIPQLWNVLKGDMAFVGPRPERPEFVQWLNEEVPFYDLRHMCRPGLTGWAQVRFRYGASLEEAKRKLEYDLYYIKHQSVGLDLLIMFETIKTILLRRGAQ